MCETPSALDMVPSCATCRGDDCGMLDGCWMEHGRHRPSIEWGSRDGDGCSRVTTSCARTMPPAASVFLRQTCLNRHGAHAGGADVRYSLRGMGDPRDCFLAPSRD